MRRHLMWTLAMLVACTGTLCSDPGYLAELETHRGEVQRDHAAAVGAWGKVARGDRFQVGDGLRTGKTGTARLALAADGVALIEANTRLRFVDRDPRTRTRRVALEEGTVRIESGSHELDVRTEGALARLTGGASVRIVAAERALTFDVLVGKVAIDAEGATSELHAGQTLAVPVKPSSVDDAGARPEEPTAREAEPPAVTTPAPGPVPVDVALTTLEPATLHTPSLPVTLRTPESACGAALTKVELDGKAHPHDSAGRAALRIARAGAYRVRIACGRRIVDQAVLRVQRDAAHAELPSSAPHVEVEADGRRYTVRYQNLLPVVRMRWSDARPATAYVLLVRRGQRTRRFETTRPEHALLSSEVAEGTHMFWFTSASGQKSAASTLRIEFDNTARALSLTEPVEGSTAVGDQATVSGVALLGSSVWANGVPLTLDAKGRFGARAPLAAERTVLVRAVHPAAGVHYYLRRLR